MGNKKIRNNDNCSSGKNDFLDGITNHLYWISSYRIQLKLLQDISDENRKEIFENNLFSNYWRLMDEKILMHIVKIAGKRYGNFYKLVKSYYPENERDYGRKIITEIEKLINSSGLKVARNALSHELSGNYPVIRSSITEIVELIYKLFDKVLPHMMFREVIGADHPIRSIISSIKYQKELRKIKGAINRATIVSPLSPACPLEGRTDSASGVTILYKEGKEILRFKI